MSVIPGKPGLATFGDYPHGLGSNRHMTEHTPMECHVCAVLTLTDTTERLQDLRGRLPDMAGPGDVDEALRAILRPLSAIVDPTREEPAHKTLEGHHDHHQP